MIGFFMAWMMFLSIPCPCIKWDETKKINMLLWMPIIGLIIGGLWYIVSILCINFNLGIVGGTLIGAFPWIITGFMHIDGFMDCSDAVLSCRSNDKKLEILKDSHVGSFAVTCMVLLGLFQIAASIQIEDRFINHKIDLLALIFIPVVTRVISVLFIFNKKALHTSSYVGLTDGITKTQKVVPWIYIIGLIILIYWLLGLNILIAILLASIIQLIVMTGLIKNLGGMSGDISGSGIVTGELASLLILAIGNFTYLR